MADDVSNPLRPTLLERLDLVLAGRLAERLAGDDSPVDGGLQKACRVTTDDDRCAWITGLLALRGFRVTRDDVARILSESSGRFRKEHQEFKLVRGFGAVLETLEQRAAAGRTPDGWWLVETFRRVTEEIGRFRRNVLRRDHPWDGLLRVGYPAPAEVGDLLDRFHGDERFGDDPAVFDALHPVRQGVRVMWRLARIAPFPDFNLPFAALAFGGYLLARGYPPLLPHANDRVQLERLVRGRLPHRSLPIERRLLEQVTGVGSARR